jgi:hypothetical protein
MNKIIFLQRLFEGYVISFRSFCWHTSSNYSDITSAELSHFSTIGEKLGYMVRREMNWEYPRDLCWVDDAESEAYLYMERESKDSRCKHTIEKMLNPENSLNIPVLVASFGFLKPESFEWASCCLKRGLLKNQSALIFAWVGENEDKGPFEVKAHVVCDGQISECLAEPSMDVGGFWQINYVNGVAEWR